MKKLMKKSSGFTLIEIIVVLIIVGILAAIALPNLFQNVAKSKSSEALVAWSGYKPGLEACMYKAGSVGAQGACTAALYIPTTANITFTFNANTPGTVVDQYTVRAANTAVPADFITLTRPATGLITCVGSGQWAGVC